MQVKHNHNCMLCSQSKTCFTFSEFSMLFALCRACYDELVRNLSLFSRRDGVCAFCEVATSVCVIDSFPDMMFFGDLQICDACLDSLKNFVEGEK